jgi:hypothetical protein
MRRKQRAKEAKRKLENGTDVKKEKKKQKERSSTDSYMD